MGKSIRSKIKKRLRTVKRQRVDAMIITPRTHELHAQNVAIMEGRAVHLSTPKNAFKYPESAGSVFPQHEILKPVDMRATHLPMAGYAFRGNRRKYVGEQLDYQKSMAKTSHPKMTVLAGGGAICAKTGKRLTKKEAKLLATQAERPHVAAMALAGMASSSSAVAEAVAAHEEEGAAEAEMDEVEEENPNRADTSRRPVVKDTRRQKRAEEHRSRPNSVKKKNKAKAKAKP